MFSATYQSQTFVVFALPPRAGDVLSVSAAGPDIIQCDCQATARVICCLVLAARSARVLNCMWVLLRALDQRAYKMS